MYDYIIYNMIIFSIFILLYIIITICNNYIIPSAFEIRPYDSREIFTLHTGEGSHGIILSLYWDI